MVIRRLVRPRICSLTVVATLALGIGGIAAVSGGTHVTPSDASYLYDRLANRTLAGVGAYAITAAGIDPAQRCGPSRQNDWRKRRCALLSPFSSQES